MFQFLRTQMNSVNYNMLFNSFLGSDIDICFDGLNFERDMLPCIKFVNFISSSNGSLAANVPLVDTMVKPNPLMMAHSLMSLHVHKPLIHYVHKDLY
mmetsp:Transcript_95663/g.206404  ORF Transcript_95663/g.206404 Transcript_95663/m.206404 type:complete len:97 (-) Transcript_95663:317-607(-)